MKDSLRLLRWTLLGVLWALPLGAEVLASEPPFLGTAPRRVFTPEDYGGSPQIWRGAEDSNGIIYFLTLASTMVRYDGERWHGVELPINVSGFAIDSDDRFFVGGDSKIGMLVWSAGSPAAGSPAAGSPAAGSPAVGSSADGASSEDVERPGFVSLMDRIPEGQRDHGGLQSILLPEDGGVIFCTLRYVYRLQDGGSLEVLAADPDIGFEGAFLWRDRLVLHRKDQGLWTLDQGDLVPVPGNSVLEPARVVGLLEAGASAALVLTDSHGIFRLDEHGVRPGPWPIGAALAEQRILSGIRTTDGGYVLTTVRAGAFRLDAEGRTLEIFDRAGDPRLNNLIYHVFEDRRGTLWLLTDQGIVQVPLAPIRRLVDPETIESSFQQTHYFAGRPYIATRTGLYRQARTERSALRPTPLSLERVPDINASTWALLPIDDVLLVGTSHGIHAVREVGGAVTVEPICASLGFTLFSPAHWPDHVIVNARGAFQILARDGEDWRCGPRIDGIEGWIRSWATSPGGEIFALVFGSHLYRLSFPGGPTAPAVVQRYELPPEIGGGSLVEINGQAVLLDKRLTPWLLATVEPSSFPFEPRPESFPGLRVDSEGAAEHTALAYHLDEDRLWLAAGSALVIAERDADGQWTRRQVSSGIVPFGGELERDPDSEKVWLTTGKGVFQWDPSVLRRSVVVRAMVRRVQEIDSRQSLWQPRPGERARAEPLVLPYARNALRFEVAAAITDQVDGPDYQVRLVGFDEGWSRWTRETVKEYTNLREGTYDFRVRARDAWGAISEEGSLRFEIEPPIYRTLWAYGLYALAFVGLLQVIVYRYRRKLEREQVINRRLREADRIKDEFLANTSHELRTPLYGIIGLAESMREAQAEVPASFRDRLSTIIASGHRLQRLLADILDFSELEKGRLDLARRPLDMESLVDRVFALLRPLADDRGVLLVNGVSGDLPPIEADEQRLEQILFNLVGNGIKFTDEGSVEVGAERRGERALVTVRDNGIGIAPENQARIFQAFEQGDGSIERRRGGMGLGLAISRRLVEKHGGRLSVESKLGEGTTFYFTLPLTDAGVEVASVAFSSSEFSSRDQLSRNPSPRDPVATTVCVTEADRALAEPSRAVDGTGAGGDSRPSRILVVDDEPVNRLILSKQLESAGFEVFEAADGFQALEQLEGLDLMLLDVMMPRISGFEVCRKVRERFPPTELPIIFVSAKGLPEDVTEGLEAGGNDYLVKPVRMQELLARITVHLDLLARYRGLSKITNSSSIRLPEDS